MINLTFSVKFTIISKVEADGKKKVSFWKKVLMYFEKHKLFGEILRFVIIGGLATIIDMFFMGLTLYIFQPQNYAHFYNVFFGREVAPSTVSAIVGTGVGFTMGLIFNYFFSIIFVFDEKGKSKSVGGFLLFSILSLMGLGIHLIGMYLGFDLLHINEWIVKIVLTLVVLVYNYLSRKLLLFKKTKEKEESEG